MTEYVGEIRLFGGSFAPSGWLFCHGQLVSIAEYEVLYVLIGTTYGGDGQSTFAVPDLRGRVPIHQGNGFVLGQAAGQEQVTLTAANLPPHSHSVAVSTSSASSRSALGVPATTASEAAWSPDLADEAMGSTTVASGGSQPHPNMQPYLAISHIIATYGIFPSQF